MLSPCVAAGAVEAQGAVKASRGNPLGGTPEGVALMVTFALPGLRGTGLLSLRSGVVVAEELRLKGGPADDIYVARNGKQTYKHTKLKPCWRPLTPTAGLTFVADVGSPSLSRTSSAS